MKSFKAILSVTLMSILILSTVGFSVSRHYCMGMLVNESFFEWSTDDCPMDERSTHCSDKEAPHSDDDHLAGSCCKDEVILINGIDVLSFSPKDLSISLDTYKVDRAPLAIFNYHHFPFLKLQPRFVPPDTGTKSGTEILIWEQRFLI